MWIEYSKKVDAIYVYFKESSIVKSKETEDRLVVGFDDKGQLIGIEVRDASKRFSLSDIIEIHIKRDL